MQLHNLTYNLHFYVFFTYFLHILSKNEVFCPFLGEFKAPTVGGGIGF